MAIVKGLNNLGRILDTKIKKSQPNKKIVNGLRTLSAKKNNTQVGPANYEVLKVVERVLVKVPKESGFMQPQPAFVSSNGFKVPAYWKNGKPLGKIFLNIQFFGVTEDNFGKNIIATIKVIKKVMSDGREFIMIDAINTPGVAPEYDLKFPEKSGKGIPIIGTNQEIEFRLRFKKS